MNNVENGNDLLTVPEMAKILKISRSKAYALVKEKDFPVIKIGKCIRISEKKVLSWLNNN